MFDSDSDSCFTSDDCDRWLEEFEDAWQATVPCLESYVAKLPSSAQTGECVLELIAIDLEHRWGAHHCGRNVPETGSLPATPLVEDYAVVVPALARPASIPLHLIISEYRSRHLFGDRPDAAEYVDRFPTRQAIVRDALLREEQRLIVEGSRAGLGAGSLFGPYEIIGPLGSGGMGDVYRARDTRLGREVAVKVLPEDVRTDRDRLARFRREAQAVAGIQHPNVMALYDVGDQDGVSYVVTELLSGETLREILRRGPLPLSHAVAIAIELADGLQAAHQAGVVHRDLKPANVVLVGDQRPVILDFGLALRQEAGRPDSLLTRVGDVMGTVGYMSPEQIRGHPVDHRTDLFALGCVIFELLTGQGPFLRETSADTSAATLTGATPRLEDVGIRVPGEVESIVRRCLATERDDRPTDAASVRDALRSVSDGQQPATGERTRPAIAGPGLAARPGPLLDSLAVLPLTNATGTDDLDYLADGIAESVIHRLSRFTDLRVMAWSTVTRHRDDTDASKLAQLMGVSGVLVGRLLLRGTRLVVRLEMVRAADGSLVWSEQFVREHERASDLETDIAHQVGEKLRLRLSTNSQSSAGPASPIAYQHYLKGRLHWNRRNATDLQKAIEHFEQAIAHDPGYARAYAGLADTHGLQVAWGRARPREVFPVARQMALRALELDQTLAEAHTSLGYVSVVYEWDWAKAEDHYRAAVQLNSNYATAHHWLGYLLMLRGRFSESEDEMRAAVLRDPLSPIISANLALLSYFARDPHEALRRCEQTLTLDDALASAHYYHGLIHEQLGDVCRAIEAFHRGIDISGGVPGELGALGHACATAGRTAEAAAALTRLAQLRQDNYITAWNEGLVRLAQDDADAGFALFEAARRDRDFYLIYLDVDPRLDPFRQESRLRRLKAQVGDDN